MRWVLATTFCVVAGAAAAQVPADRDPDWRKKPDYYSLAAAFPARALADGIEGSATINCRVTVEGFLDRCKTLNEKPEGIGFGDAALTLASQFWFTPKIRGGQPVEGEVTIPLSWMGLKDTINPGRAAHPLYSDTNWLKAPTAAQLVAAYPKDRAKGEAGQALLRCGISSAHAPTLCKVSSELPAGRGFGAAAKTLLPGFVVDVASYDSMRVKDAYLDIAVRFHGPTNPDEPLYDVRWRRKPSAAEAEALFPAAARAAGAKAGASVIECTAAAEGRLADCKPTRVRGADNGFDAAALEAAKTLRINPWTRAGEAVEGRRIALALNFKLDPPSVTPALP